MGEPWLLLDLGSRAEFQEKHIPEAVHVPLDEIEDYELRLRLYAEGRKVAFVCRGDQDPRVAALRLSRLGIQNPHQLEEGIAGWTEAGFWLETERATQAPTWIFGAVICALWLAGALFAPTLLIVAASVTGAWLGVLALDQVRRNRLLSLLPRFGRARLA